MRRSYAAVLVAIGVVGTPLAAPAQRLPLAAFGVTADEVTTENTGRILVARGHVRLTYRTGAATGDLLRLDRPASTAVLTGHAMLTDSRVKASGDTVTISLTSPDQVARVEVRGNAQMETSAYAITADSIVEDRRADRLVAQGHVAVFSPPDLLVTGERAVYDRQAQYALVTGHPVIESKEGRVEGDWMELFRADSRAVVHGPVEAEVYGATIKGEEATIDLQQSTAIFTGHVVIARRQGTLSADRATIFYKARRIVAEGTTHATFSDMGDTALP
jgi:lipopolysaccharide assembly outer membrane protein LptD (OstA)